MRKWALPILATLVVATVGAGCMSSGKSDRSARKAAIGSEPPPSVHASLDIAGNRVNVRSFSWGIDGPHAHELSLVRLVDANSPPFFVGTAEGTTYRTVTLTLVRDDGTTAGTYVFSDAIITSFQNSLSAGESALESLALSYQKVDFTYGTANGCFEFTRGRRC